MVIDFKSKKIKKYGKIISLDDHKKELVFNNVKEILDELIDDGGEVTLTDDQLRVILDEFYEYYKKKGIMYCFEEAMLDHFNDICDDAYDEDANMDLEYTLGELALYELVDSRVEVNPKETKRIIKTIRSKNNGVLQ